MSAIEYTWRDSELRSWPLRAINSVGSGIRRFGIDKPTLSAQAVVQSAIKAAGSDDFGGESYREPLDVFIGACHEEAELTTFGRLLIGKMLQRALSNRLRVRPGVTDHPTLPPHSLIRPP